LSYFSAISQCAQYICKIDDLRRIEEGNFVLQVNSGMKRKILPRKKGLSLRAGWAALPTGRHQG
jgi:hypothetical protein